VVACGATLLAGLPGAARADEPLTILFYGNSFTLGSGSSEAEVLGGVPGVVGILATAAGHADPNIENAAASGQTLTWHLTNNLAVISTPQDFVADPGFQWDYVVLQGYSTRPTHIGALNQFRTDLLALYGEVRSHSPGAGAILYETWARAPGHEYYSGANPSFPGGPAQMQEELRAGYREAEQDIDITLGADRAWVAPVGDAWEDTGWANLHASDLYHANSRGTYLAALVIYGTVYSESVVGLPKVFGSLTEQEAADLQAYADAVIPHPCGAAGSDCNANCVPDWRETDCNGNTIPDDCDISAGTSDDCDGNGVPDECERIWATVWSDDFDTDTSAAWTIIAGGSGDSAVFNFDYGAASIPSAPNSQGGTTRGLKMTANTAAGPAAPSGVCAFPTGWFFDGDFSLRWDMYISWNSPESTEHACFGINHSGSRLAGSEAVTSDSDGVFFAVAGDGGDAVGYYPTGGVIKDYNAYYGNEEAAPTRLPVPHWDETQPLLRDLFPAVSGDPIGDSAAGSPGRQWVEGEITQQDGVVTWKLNGTVIYEAANESGFDSGNIMLGLFDHYVGQNTTGHAFVIFDNVRVAIPSSGAAEQSECLTGPCPTAYCDPPLYDGLCCIVDADGDGDVDLVDFAESQIAYVPPPPELAFQPDELTLSVVQDETTQGTTIVVASDSSTPIVKLVAIDQATQEAPTWLSLPASWVAGSPITLDVDALGLSLGSHWATVTAFAPGYVDCTLEVYLTVTPAVTNDVVLVDFGSPTLTTSGAPRYWNNVHTSNMGSAIPLDTAAGESSGIVLTIDPSYRFNGANTNGTTSPAPSSDLDALQYPITALQDSLFGNSIPFSGGTFPVARITLSGLDPTATYDLIFFASRMGVADIRTTDYLVIGSSVAMETLDASNNQSEIAGILDMGPNAQNAITITIDKGATNTNEYGFYYLGTLEIRKNTD
jgi:hypothetical protein